jgi:hypothetical protein
MMLVPFIIACNWRTTWACNGAPAHITAFTLLRSNFLTSGSLVNDTAVAGTSLRIVERISEHFLIYWWKS